jgi:hypothetical protein
VTRRACPPLQTDLKRAIKDVPSRLSELQVQNMRPPSQPRPPQGMGQAPAPPSAGDFSFPTFPAPPPSPSPLYSRRGKDEASLEGKVRHTLGRIDSQGEQAG